MNATATLRDKARHAWLAVRGDGCTQVPDFTEAFTRCCNHHDADYSTHSDARGNRITRAKADARLLRCLRCNAVTLIGRYFIAPAYYIGVRMFGRAYWKRKIGVKREAISR